MCDYKFIMPWPPSVGSCWRAYRNRFILSANGRDYRKRAIEHLKSIGLSGELIESNVSVSLILNPPTLRRYDVDNFQKAILDSFSHAEFWIDDSQVQKITITKGEKIKGGNVIVSVNIIAQT